MTTIDPNTILKEADNCVKCGLCLSVCPTFQVSKMESRSPRGRISLMQGIANQQLELTPALTQHLDTCLQCEACANACPSNVNYHHLIQQTREHLQQNKAPLKRSPAFFRLAVRHPILGLALAKLIRLLQRPVIRKTLKYFALGPLKKPLNLLQLSAVPFKHRTRTQKNTNHTPVIFWPGCSSQLLESELNADVCTLLNKLGYAVTIPPGIPCCGALHAHSAQTKQAQLSQQRLNNYLQHIPHNTPILSLNTGCLAHLLRAHNIDSSRFYDLCQWLTKTLQTKSVSFVPLKQRVVLFRPCSERNILHRKQTNPVQTLLDHIPDITLLSPVLPISCCGGAGDYFLKHDKLAKSILEPHQIWIKQLEADIIVSPNISCTLQLRSLVKTLNSNARVMHPISLIAQQLPLNRP
jgi:glycolate oxidase iron-sulfur subunit